MANVAGPRSIMRIGYVTINGQKHPVEVERSAFQFFEDLWLRTGGDDDDVEAGANAAETAQAAADTAQAAADAAEASRRTGAASCTHLVDRRSGSVACKRPGRRPSDYLYFRCNRGSYAHSSRHPG